MKLIEFIKLILKHKILLLIVPLFMGGIVVLLTTNSKKKYYSQTILYTGLASGSSIEMEKSFNYFATNIAFDNLINIINSRETQEEVAIRLLSKHLLLEQPNDKYISKEAFYDLKDIVPEQVLKKISITKDSIDNNYEKTVRNLIELMNSDNENFVYSLLNYDHPYYSLEAISEVKSERVSNSDLVRLSYQIDDPGICQQTLVIFNEVCIKKYKNLKEKGSDAVVKYFEEQLKQSEKKLKSIEERLLKFNQDNSIINYYEQSKAVAIVKEDLDVEYNNKKAELAGSEASTKKLEQKLEIQELVQEKSNQILENKKKLGELQYNIAMTEAISAGDDSYKTQLEELNKQSIALEREIKSSVDKLYTFQNSVEGVPLTKVLPEWVDKVVETEDLKAKLEVLDENNKIYEKQYAKYAPAGANLKRIEREIEVAEEEYIEILHGLNLAKLKFQDTQLASNLKTVDPPYFPLKPIPSKRKLLILAIVLFSFIILLSSIVLMEYFDNTLKNLEVAQKKIQIPALGMIPKFLKNNSKVDIVKVQNRIMSFIYQNIYSIIDFSKTTNKPKTIVIFSTRENEGKTVIATNIAKTLKNKGKRVLLLNHAEKNKNHFKKNHYSILAKFLGYPDPRIDYSQTFLSNPICSLSEKEYKIYKKDNVFSQINNYQDLLIQNISEEPDFVIIELPNLLESNYPIDLISNSDLAILVCRSNRLWNNADGNILNKIKKIRPSNIQFIINGVELKEMESILGEIPKYDSKTSPSIKDILRLQKQF